MDKSPPVPANSRRIGTDVVCFPRKGMSALLLLHILVWCGAPVHAQDLVNFFPDSSMNAGTFSHELGSGCSFLPEAGNPGNNVLACDVSSEGSVHTTGVVPFGESFPGMLRLQFDYRLNSITSSGWTLTRPEKDLLIDPGASIHFLLETGMWDTLYVIDVELNRPQGQWITREVDIHHYQVVDDFRLLLRLWSVWADIEFDNILLGPVVPRTPNPVPAHVYGSKYLCVFFISSSDLEPNAAHDLLHQQSIEDSLTAQGIEYDIFSMNDFLQRMVTDVPVLMDGDNPMYSRIIFSDWQVEMYLTKAQKLAIENYERDYGVPRVTFQQVGSYAYHAPTVVGLGTWDLGAFTQWSVQTTDACLMAGVDPTGMTIAAATLKPIEFGHLADESMWVATAAAFYIGILSRGVEDRTELDFYWRRDDSADNTELSRELDGIVFNLDRICASAWVPSVATKPLLLTVTFTEDVTGFDSPTDDVVVSLPATVDITPDVEDAAKYVVSIDVEGDTGDTFTLMIPANAAQGRMSGNAEFDPETVITIDVERPFGVITVAEGTNVDYWVIDITVTWNEEIMSNTGTAELWDCITVSEGAGILTYANVGLQTIYSIGIDAKPALYEIAVAENMCVDSVWNYMQGSEEPFLLRTGVPVSPETWMSTIGSLDPVTHRVIIQVNFGAPVQGFDEDAPLVVNGHVTPGSVVHISAQSYTFEVTCWAGGKTTTISIPANAVEDIVWEQPNLASVTQQFTPGNSVASTVSFVSDPLPEDTEFDVEISFASHMVVEELTEDDLVVENGAVRPLSVNLITPNNVFGATIDVSPEDPTAVEFMVRVYLGAGVVTSTSTGSGNANSNFMASPHGNSSPISVTITSEGVAELDTLNFTPIPITVAFDREAVGFEETDLDLTNCYVVDGTFGLADPDEGTTDAYVFDVDIVEQGDVVVTVPALVAKSQILEVDNDAASFEFAVDTIEPTLTFESDYSSLDEVITITATFSEEIDTDFITLVDVKVTNGAVVDFDSLEVVNPGFEYKLQINVGDGGGDVEWSITTTWDAGEVPDLHGNIMNTEPSIVTNHGVPTPVNSTLVSDVPEYSLDPAVVTLQLSREVASVSASDLSVTNGEITSWSSDSDTEYVFEVSPLGDGLVEVVLLAGAIVSPYLMQPNLESNRISFTADSTPPTVMSMTTDESDRTNLFYTITVTFSEDIDRDTFDRTDIQATNADLSLFKVVSDSVYTVRVSSTSPLAGAVEWTTALFIDGDSFADKAGNAGEGVTLWDRDQRFLDRPEVELSVLNTPTSNDDIVRVRAIFDADVEGVEAGDFEVDGGTLVLFEEFSASHYEVEVQMGGSVHGLSIQLVDEAATDLTWGFVSFPSNTLLLDYSPPTYSIKPVLGYDTPITPLLLQDPPKDWPEFMVEITFDEEVYLNKNDFEVEGATLVPASWVTVDAYVSTLWLRPIDPNVTETVSMRLKNETVSDPSGNAVTDIQVVNVTAADVACLFSDCGRCRMRGSLGNPSRVDCLCAVGDVICEAEKAAEEERLKALEDAKNGGDDSDDGGKGGGNDGGGGGGADDDGDGGDVDGGGGGSYELPIFSDYEEDIPFIPGIGDEVAPEEEVEGALLEPSDASEDFLFLNVTSIEIADVDDCEEGSQQCEGLSFHGGYMLYIYGRFTVPGGNVSLAIVTFGDASDEYKGLWCENVEVVEYGVLSCFLPSPLVADGLYVKVLTYDNADPPNLMWNQPLHDGVTISTVRPQVLSMTFFAELEGDVDCASSTHCTVPVGSQSIRAQIRAIPEVVTNSSMGLVNPFRSSFLRCLSLIIHDSNLEDGTVDVECFLPPSSSTFFFLQFTAISAFGTERHSDFFEDNVRLSFHPPVVYGIESPTVCPELGTSCTGLSSQGGQFVTIHGMNFDASGVQVFFRSSAAAAAQNGTTLDGGHDISDDGKLSGVTVGNITSTQPTTTIAASVDGNQLTNPSPTQQFSTSFQCDVQNTTRESIVCKTRPSLGTNFIVIVYNRYGDQWSCSLRAALGSADDIMQIESSYCTPGVHVSFTDGVIYNTSSVPASGGELHMTGFGLAEDPLWVQFDTGTRTIPCIRPFVSNHHTRITCVVGRVPKDLATTNEVTFVGTVQMSGATLQTTLTYEGGERGWIDNMLDIVLYNKLGKRIGASVEEEEDELVEDDDDGSVLISDLDSESGRFLQDDFDDADSSVEADFEDTSLTDVDDADDFEDGEDVDDVDDVDGEGEGEGEVVVVNPWTAENGTRYVIEVSLPVQPIWDVTVDVSIDNAREAEIVSPASQQLVFTSGDWNVIQEVVVAGVDDALDDGDIAYQVRIGPATSKDTRFSGFWEVIELTNVDDDVSGVIVGASNDLYGTDSSAIASRPKVPSLSVRLGSEPTDTVAVRMDITATVLTTDSSDLATANATGAGSSSNSTVAMEDLAPAVDSLLEISESSRGNSQTSSEFASFSLVEQISGDVTEDSLTLALERRLHEIEWPGSPSEREETQVVHLLVIAYTSSGDPNYDRIETEYDLLVVFGSPSDEQANLVNLKLASSAVETFYLPTMTSSERGLDVLWVPPTADGGTSEIGDVEDGADQDGEAALSLSTSSSSLLDEDWAVDVVVTGRTEVTPSAQVLVPTDDVAIFSVSSLPVYNASSVDVSVRSFRSGWLPIVTVMTMMEALPAPVDLEGVFTTIGNEVLINSRKFQDTNEFNFTIALGEYPTDPVYLTLSTSDDEIAYSRNESLVFLPFGIDESEFNATLATASDGEERRLVRLPNPRRLQTTVDAAVASGDPPPSKLIEIVLVATSGEFDVEFDPMVSDDKKFDEYQIPPISFEIVDEYVYVEPLLFPGEICSSGLADSMARLAGAIWYILFGLCFLMAPIKVMDTVFDILLFFQMPLLLRYIRDFGDSSILKEFVRYLSLFTVDFSFFVECDASFGRRYASSTMGVLALGAGMAILVRLRYMRMKKSSIKEYTAAREWLMMRSARCVGAVYTLCHAPVFVYSMRVFDCKDDGTFVHQSDRQCFEGEHRTLCAMALIVGIAAVIPPVLWVKAAYCDMSNLKNPPWSMYTVNLMDDSPLPFTFVGSFHSLFVFGAASMGTYSVQSDEFTLFVTASVVLFVVTLGLVVIRPFVRFSRAFAYGMGAFILTAAIASDYTCADMELGCMESKSDIVLGVVILFLLAYTPWSIYDTVHNRLDDWTPVSPIAADLGKEKDLQDDWAKKVASINSPRAMMSPRLGAAPARLSPGETPWVLKKPTHTIHQWVAEGYVVKKLSPMRPPPIQTSSPVEPLSLDDVDAQVDTPKSKSFLSSPKKILGSPLALSPWSRAKKVKGLMALTQRKQASAHTPDGFSISGQTTADDDEGLGDEFSMRRISQSQLMDDIRVVDEDAMSELNLSGDEGGRIQVVTAIDSPASGSGSSMSGEGSGANSPENGEGGEDAPVKLKVPGDEDFSTLNSPRMERREAGDEEEDVDADADEDEDAGPATPATPARRVFQPKWML